ncbi:MAG TPA: hypothetical protein VN973_05170 [Candidatus Dormibacteraeota bacterium]|nr:hypothetical protein [Candidatus Dormibacteraeota bacterium]
MVATSIRFNGAFRSVFIHGTALARSTYWLSGALTLVTALAVAATFFIPGVLRGPAVMNGSARGTALVILAVGVPALLIAMGSAAKGSIRALIVWLGVIAYLSYNAVMFIFATPFNQLFLLYVAMFSLCFWSATSILHQVDLEALRARFSPRLPVRGLAAYALVIVALNGLVWLRNVVPSVLSSTPPSWLDGTGLGTHPVYVLDLAFWLPLMAVAAVWLWRRRPWGYVLVGSILTMWVIESVGVAVDQWMGSAADPASNVASASMTPVFAVLALIGLIPLYFYFHHLDGVD